MKKTGIAAMLLFCTVVLTTHAVPANLSWKIISEVALEGEPLDIAATADWQTLFVLIQGEIVVYKNFPLQSFRFARLKVRSLILHSCS
jgi:hypothetical protein